MKLHFNPTWSAGDILPMIVSAPALDEGHPDETHLLQLVQVTVALGLGFFKHLNRHLQPLSLQGGFGESLSAKRSDEF